MTVFILDRAKDVPLLTIAKLPQLSQKLQIKWKDVTNSPAKLEPTTVMKDW